MLLAIIASLASAAVFMFRDRGHVGFLGHNDYLEFRNIQIKELPTADKDNTPPEGFTAVFNGRDLTNWKGLLASPNDNPAKRAKLSPDQLQKAQAEADDSMRKHWKAIDGALEFDGKGRSLATMKDYGNFEMLVDWKILPKGDSGIYLRGSPQVQIWDANEGGKRNKMGSGGLYNNEKNPADPVKLADKPIGEWNRFRILMIGDRVHVFLNNELVVDNTGGHQNAQAGAIRLDSGPHIVVLEYQHADAPATMKWEWIYDGDRDRAYKVVPRWALSEQRVSGTTVTSARVVEALQPDLLQLHGSENPERLRDIKRKFGLPLMKVIAVETAADLASLSAYADIADRNLFDARAPEDATRPGGLGAVFDWRVLEKLDLKLPFMVSGGLDAENIAQALRVSRAGGVDVSSGVERSPGIKDPEMIRAFIRAARATEELMVR